MARHKVHKRTTPPTSPRGAETFGYLTAEDLAATPVIGHTLVVDGAGTGVEWAVPSGGGTQGSQGPPGNDGSDGEDGPPGPAGPAGTAGATGSPGSTGAAGPIGPAVFLEADAGEQGEAGPPGATGPQGATGAQGNTGAAGPIGPAVFLDAEQGEQGEAGPPGATGPQGTTGAQGNTGGAGPSGPAVFLDAEQGEQGDIGPPGVAGPQGTQGSAGGTGATGPAGPGLFFLAEDGEDGERGPPGATGATGAAGSGGSATTIERDLGSTAKWSGKFTITDAAIASTSKVLCWQAPGPYTGKGTRADEAEAQPVSVIAVEPATGSAVVKWQTPPMIVESPLMTRAPNFGGGTAANSGTNRDVQTTATRIGKVRGNVKFSYVVFA